MSKRVTMTLPALRELLRESVAATIDELAPDFPPMHPALHDNDVLRSENAQLREEREAFAAVADRLRVRCHGIAEKRNEVGAENERLRADLAALYAAVERLRTCSGREYHGVVNALFALLPAERHA